MLTYLANSDIFAAIRRQCPNSVTGAGAAGRSRAQQVQQAQRSPDQMQQAQQAAAGRKTSRAGASGPVNQFLIFFIFPPKKTNAGHFCIQIVSSLQDQITGII